ncbi:MAG: hypothetical protein CL484_00725 [Acidobacteria bacterium]|nr:hypothetical protein [Acidobacteriota bacterium]|tara:strand:- start:385 stop:870 length:486 start_codon:yes stop_codon:yes gene_type:complete
MIETLGMGRLPTLVMRATADEGIRRHSQEVYPNESCGALIGCGEMVTEAVPLPNTTDEGTRRRFCIQPADYIVAERRANEIDGKLIGFYHSHPDDSACPSQYDLDHAWPTFAYVILAVRGGDPTTLRSWRLREDRSAFDEQRVKLEPQDAIQSKVTSGNFR